VPLSLAQQSQWFSKISFNHIKLGHGRNAGYSTSNRLCGQNKQLLRLWRKFCINHNAVQSSSFINFSATEYVLTPWMHWSLHVTHVLILKNWILFWEHIYVCYMLLKIKAYYFPKQYLCKRDILFSVMSEVNFEILFTCTSGFKGLSMHHYNEWPLLSHDTAQYNFLFKVHLMTLSRASNDRITSEYGIWKMWREVVIAYYEFLHQQLPGGTEEYHKKPQSG
jgi:hypothetical protein